MTQEKVIERLINERYIKECSDPILVTRYINLSIKALYSVLNRGQNVHHHF
jgi:hypothetical protein